MPFSPAKLRAALVAAGLSQREAAKRAGLPQQVMNRLATGGRRSPRIETLQRVAAVIGCKFTDLIE